jgi:hypothetical protein
MIGGFGADLWGGLGLEATVAAGTVHVKKVEREGS